MITKARTRIAGLLTGCAAVTACLSLQFSHSVFASMIERTGVAVTDLPRVAAFALWLTRPWIVVSLLVACLCAVAVSEVRVRDESSRLLIQLAILVLAALVLAVALSGFFMPFHIPDVHIE